MDVALLTDLGAAAGAFLAGIGGTIGLRKVRARYRNGSPAAESSGSDALTRALERVERAVHQRATETQGKIDALSIRVAGIYARMDVPVPKTPSKRPRPRGRK